MLNAAIDSGLADDNMPSPPPEKRGDSSKPSSKKDLQDLHQELDYTKSKLLNVETKFDHLKVRSDILLSCCLSAFLDRKSLEKRWTSTNV